MEIFICSGMGSAQVLLSWVACIYPTTLSPLCQCYQTLKHIMSITSSIPII